MTSSRNIDTIVNPTIISGVLLAYGHTRRNTEAAVAYEAFGRGPGIAQANGDRQLESVLAMNLASLSALHAEPADALDFSALAIRT
jgi:hypothetical protein